MINQLNIQKRLALVLWGSIMLAFFLAGSGLVIYENLTLEARIKEIIKPYAQLVSVGAETAVAFQDPQRAQEILDTLRANTHILEAAIYLDNGRILAGFNQLTNTMPTSFSTREEGIYIEQDRATYLQQLPSGAHLHITMSMDQLKAQTLHVLWIFIAFTFILLIATLAQLAVLRRMIVRPIKTLMKTAEHIRTSADYEQRVSARGNDEVARLGHSFNAMMEAIHEKQELLLEAQQIAHLGNWKHDLASNELILSDEVFNILGQKPQQMTLEKSFAWIHLDDLQLFKRTMQTSSSDKDEMQLEFRIVRPNGETRWVHNRWKNVFDEQGNLINRIGTYQDISDRKFAEESLRQMNRELRAISECNQELVRAEDELTLVESICRIVCDEAGYLMAWVGYAEHDEAKSVRTVARYGIGASYLEQAHISWDDTDHGRGPTGTAIRSGEIQVVDDFSSDAGAAPWREAALRSGYRSSIALPLKDTGNHTFGVLNIYSEKVFAFSIEEQRLLEELSYDLAYGIVALRTRDDHNRAEEQIRIAATAFEAQEGILITDLDQKILRVNRAFSEITGYPAGEIVGRTPKVLKSEIHDQHFFDAMWDSIMHKGAWHGEIWNRRRNGEIFPAWVNITAVKDTQGEITHFVGTFTDITERKEAEKQIEHLAYYDLLTGLPNRQLLMDRLHQAIAGSARSNHKGALLFIDLDNFKILNDTCGHDIGDQLLVDVARRLATCVREGDTISRLGGDEFIVLLQDLSKNNSEAASQAKIAGEKILTILNRPYNLAGRVHHSTTSIGATLFDGSEKTVDELLKQADIAMYQAKTAGRNTLRFFDPVMQANLAARADIEAALRMSIQSNGFILHYQQQVDGNRGVIGAEALLRWLHPQSGLVMPGDFISLAEETGLIYPIGEWVLENACRQLAIWSRDGQHAHLDMAVNVSALQFHKKDFVDSVNSALRRSGAPATHLKLELTESLVLENISESIEKMHALKVLGIGLSLDDFGTGYSSLSYLTRLPLDQLKIDRSFIQQLPQNSSDAVVVQAIITLAQSLGITVIAEGVESKEQQEFLERHGCTIYQGYRFGKPMELAAFEASLQDSLLPKASI